VISQVTPYFLSLLCLGSGGLLAFWQPGPRRFIGVRLGLPWTYADREIWGRAWRLAGRILLVMAATALISYTSFLITTVHLVVLSQLYPAFLYRRKYGTFSYWQDPGRREYYPVARCAHCGHLENLTDPGKLPETRCAACGRHLRAS
jgi:hypothetical protein